ncbi:MAG: hypothetical protein ACKO5A_07735 [Actinomycetota bacterium]
MDSGPAPDAQPDVGKGSAARSALVALVALAWVLILGFYALVGASMQWMDPDRPNTPVAAAIAAVAMAVVGVLAGAGARRRSWANAWLIALGVGLSGGAANAWVYVASGTRTALPLAAALTASAAAALLLGVRSRHNAGRSAI